MTPKPQQTDAQTALVIGAGIIGVTCALELQKSGFQVTLIDPAGVGEETSKGNAGCIASAEITPMASPGMWKHIPKWLLDPLGPLTLRPTYLPKLVPWLTRFMATSDIAKLRESAKALAAIMRLSDQTWDTWQSEFNLASHITRNGTLCLYRSEKALLADQLDRDVKRDNGFASQIINKHEISKLEPNLRQEFSHGVYYDAYRHVSDPYVIVHFLHQAFTALGGTTLQSNVTALHPSQKSIRLEGGETMEAKIIVLCAGAWSKALLKPLGLRVLLESERGYNTTLPHAGAMLNRPIAIAESKFVMSPLKCGLRIGGAAEFAGLTAPANYRRSEALLTLGRRCFDQLDERDASQWMGQRPSTPDSLPVIGRAPGHDNLLLGFGHGHLGLTLAPATAKIIASLAQNVSPAINLNPFSINRFM